jgi:hypothetical protein
MRLFEVDVAIFSSNECSEKKRVLDHPDCRDSVVIHFAKIRQNYRTRNESHSFGFLVQEE